MTPEPVECYRCGKPGHCAWADVSIFGDAEPSYVATEQYCLTPGCTDPDGSRRLVPPTPYEMRAKAHRMWIDRHRALVENR